MRQLKAISRFGCSALAAILLVALPGNSSRTHAGTRQIEGGDVADVKTFDVIASQFRFHPASISIAEGDSVRLRLRSADRTHAFGIKAFGVKAVIPRGGATVAVEFVADHAGTFDFTCAEYCGTGHSGMKGKLIVSARK